MALDRRIDDDDVIPLEIVAVDLIVAAATETAAVVVPIAMLTSRSKYRDGSGDAIGPKLLHV